MKAASGDRARRQRPTLEAVGLGAERWRVSEGRGNALTAK